MLFFLIVAHFYRFEVYLQATKSCQIKTMKPCFFIAEVFGIYVTYVIMGSWFLTSEQRSMPKVSINKDGLYNQAKIYCSWIFFVCYVVSKKN